MWFSYNYLVFQHNEWAKVSKMLFNHVKNEYLESLRFLLLAFYEYCNVNMMLVLSRLEFSLMIGALYYKRALLTIYSRFSNKGKVLAFFIGPGLSLIIKFAVNSKEGLLLIKRTNLKRKLL